MTFAAFLFALVAWIMPPCTDEDSTHCYWDASTMGNGQGVSFVDWGNDV